MEGVTNIIVSTKRERFDHRTLTPWVYRRKTGFHGVKGKWDKSKDSYNEALIISPPGCKKNRSGTRPALALWSNSACLEKTKGERCLNSMSGNADRGGKCRWKIDKKQGSESSSEYLEGASTPTGKIHRKTVRRM